jgi:hypothetical protein
MGATFPSRCDQRCGTEVAVAMRVSNLPSNHRRTTWASAAEKPFPGPEFSPGRIGLSVRGPRGAQFATNVVCLYRNSDFCEAPGGLWHHLLGDKDMLETTLHPDALARMNMLGDTLQQSESDCDDELEADPPIQSDRRSANPSAGEARARREGPRGASAK